MEPLKTNATKETQLMSSAFRRARAGLLLSFCLPQRNFCVMDIGFLFCRVGKDYIERNSPKDGGKTTGIFSFHFFF